MRTLLHFSLKIRTKIATSLLTALLLFPSSFQLRAQGLSTVAQDCEIYTNSSHPDTVLAQAKPGKPYDVLYVGDEWLKIIVAPKKFGWVKREFVNMPSPDSVIISRNWPLMRDNGHHATDTLKPKVGRVVKGMSAQKVMIYDGWYEIQLADGTDGWVHQNAIAPSLSDIVKTKRSVYLLQDTVRKKFVSNSELPDGRRIVELARGTQWSKIRTADGREGWVLQRAIENDDALPGQARSVFWYRLFKGFEKIGNKHWTLALFVLVMQWFGVFVLTALIPFLLIYFSVGQQKFVSNSLLKAVYGTTLVAFGVYCIMYFFPSVPPYMGGFSEGIMTFWGGFLIVLATMALLRRISYDRCNSCRRINAGVVVGNKFLGSNSNTETTRTTWTYGDGHTESETKARTSETSHNLKTLQCKYCHYMWQISESYTSSSTKTVKPRG